MRIRQGRHQPQNLYIQHGAEPSDDDHYIGVIFDPVRAAYIAAVLNGEKPAFGQGQ